MADWDYSSEFSAAHFVRAMSWKEVVKFQVFVLQFPASWQI